MPLFDRSFALGPGAVLDYAEFTANVACTAASEAAANTIVTSAALVYDGATIVKFEFFCPSYSISLTTEDGTLSLFEDGSAIGQLFAGRASAAGIAAGMIFVARRHTPAAGSHTYSVRGFVAAVSTFTVVAGAGGAATKVPGFLRIEKVN